MADVIEELNASFGLGEAGRFSPGEGGLPRLLIQTPAASGELYLHGAQVTAWRPADHEEVLFVSHQSRWEAGKAIRGGIPVCFPWFRNKSDDSRAPAHGFARTRSWQVVSVVQEGDGVTATLAIESDEDSLRWWLHAFRATLQVHFGAQLTVALTVVNTGKAPLSFEEALHTYFQVGQVERVRVHGLNGVTYLDNVDQNHEKTQSGDLVLTGTTDNAYLNTLSVTELIDPILRRTVRTEKENSRTTVVWNPWQQGAASLSDLGEDEWRRMTCVEASNVLSCAVSLAPGEEHTMRATLSITPERSALPE